MESIVTYLCATDVFLVETQDTQTGYISAEDINFLSYQFPKKLNLIKSPFIKTDEVRGSSLTAANIRLLTSQTSTISGNFNTYVINAGLVVSAYNTQTSEITAVSATINNKISALSADVYNVFFDSGTARLAQYIHSYSVGALQLDLSGTKIIPQGLTIKSSDITFSVYYNGITPGTYVQVLTTSSLVYVKDFDYNFLNFLQYGEDDFGDNYGTGGSVVGIPFIIVNTAEPPPALLAWKVLKFY